MSNMIKGTVRIQSSRAYRYHTRRLWGDITLTLGGHVDAGEHNIQRSRTACIELACKLITFTFFFPKLSKQLRIAFVVVTHRQD
jgi:hypothetical protein